METDTIQTIVYGIILGWLIYDNWKFGRLHEVHQYLIHDLSVSLMSLNIRHAIIDLQMGNIPYSVVKKVIDQSGLNKSDMEFYNSMLEEVVFAYNIKKDEE